ncbi:MFS transporter [Candidatus Peregrinibacteria bacterium]|nr:MFS transporter [Candidatus Peregrinibacteria bacterium]
MKESKKTVRIFALASFLNDMGSDMIAPLWPVFVTSVLGANMAILGLIDGLGEALMSLSQAISGYISDRIKKRKVFVWLGYCCGGLSRVGYAFSTVWQELIPFRILDRAGKMRAAPRDAIIAEVSTHKNRGKNFGIIRMMDNLGATVGIILSILLFQWLSYKQLFLIASIPSVVAVLLVFFFIKEKKTSETKIFKGIKLKHLTRNLKLFFGMSALFALGAFSYSFLMIYANRFGVKPIALPLLYLLFSAVASLVSIAFGKLADKKGRKFVLWIAYGLWGLACASLIISQNLIMIIIVFALYGLHKGALEPVQAAFVSELAPPEYKASVLGGLRMIVGLCALPSSLLAGLLWDKSGLLSPLYFSLGLTVLSLILLAFIKEKRTN